MDDIFAVDNKQNKVTFNVVMKWNEPTEQWRMLFLNKTIQEFARLSIWQKLRMLFTGELKTFFDCPNFGRFFKGSDKTNPTTYQITIAKE